MTIRVSFLAVCLCLFSFLSPIFAGGGEEESQPPAPLPRMLEEVEVLEYKGEELSPIDTSFRDNSIGGPQYVDKETYRLAIDGIVDTPLSMTYDEVLQLQSYEKVVTLHCVEGWSAKVLWEGVLVRDLLQAAGADTSAAVVIFHAVDTYTTSLPLSDFYDKDLLMAFKMNGRTIPYELGFPFFLVAENKWGYKWIKWIERIEVSDDAEYRGFWESNGYDNVGDLDMSRFERAYQ